LFDPAGGIFADVADGGGFSAIGFRQSPKVYRRRTTAATIFQAIDPSFFSAGSVRAVDDAGTDSRAPIMAAARVAAYNARVFARGVRGGTTVG